MDGMEIINSFKKETIYEFSEAIPVFNDDIYFIFKVDIISIDANPSKTRIDKLKKLIKDSENSENFISHLDIEPIAYILKTKIESINEDESNQKCELEHKEDYEIGLNNERKDYKIESINERYDYEIESINEKYYSFVEENKNGLLEEFLKRKSMLWKYD